MTTHAGLRTFIPSILVSTPLLTATPLHAVETAPPPDAAVAPAADTAADPPSVSPPSTPPEPAPLRVAAPAPEPARPLVWNADSGPVRDTVAPPAASKSTTNSLGGFLDFNAYPYLSEVKSDSVFTLNAAAKLPYGFSYFSLTNILNQDGASPFQDTNGFYTEQNLRWSFPAPVPVDLTFQYNMRGGLDNDRWRFGFRWRAEATPGLDAVMKAIALAYSVNFHVLQLDDDPGYVWQMEHVARLDTPYLDRRVYIAGFMDHTFNQGYEGIPEDPIVLEVQGGLRAVDELYAVAEYRVNQYRANAESNLALGAEYLVKW